MQSTWPSAAKALSQIQELALRWNVVGALPLKWSFVASTKSATDQVLSRTNLHTPQWPYSNDNNQVILHENAEDIFISNPNSTGDDLDYSHQSSTVVSNSPSTMALTLAHDISLKNSAELMEKQYNASEIHYYGIGVEQVPQVGDDPISLDLELLFDLDPSALNDVFNLNDSWGAF